MSRRTDYDAYIHSAEWRHKADAALVRANYRCEECRRSSRSVRLEVCHRTYARLGREHESDLVVLCRECHLEVELRGQLPSRPDLHADVPHPARPKDPTHAEFITLDAAASAATAAAPRSWWTTRALIWATAIVVGGGLLWIVFGGSNLPGLADQTEPAAAAMVTPVLLPTPTPTPASESAAGLAAAQRVRYPAADFPAVCPYTNTNTNLRTGPSTEQTQVILVLPVGSCVPVAAQTADGAWYAFALDLTDGTQTVAWVFAGLVVDAPADLPTLTPLPAAAPAATPKPLPLRAAAAALPAAAVPLPTATPLPPTTP